MVIYWDLMGFTGIFHGNQCWFECWVFMMISNVNSYCRFLWWSNGGVKRKFLVVARLVSRAGQLWWRSTTRNDGMEYQRDTLKFLPIFLSSMNIISGLSNGIHQTKSSFLEYQEYQTKYQTFHVWATLWNSSHLESSSMEYATDFTNRWDWSAPGPVGRKAKNTTPGIDRKGSSFPRFFDGKIR